MCSFSNLFDYGILNLRGQFSMKHTLGMSLNMELSMKILDHWQSKNILDVECLKQKCAQIE